MESDSVKASLNPAWGDLPVDAIVNPDGQSKKVIQVDCPVYPEFLQHQRVELVLWDKDIYTKK